MLNTRVIRHQQIKKNARGPKTVVIFIQRNTMISNMQGSTWLREFLGRALRLGQARGKRAAAIFIKNNTMISDMWGQVRLRQFLGRALRLGQARRPSAVDLFIKNNIMISDMWGQVRLRQVEKKTKCVKKIHEKVENDVRLTKHQSAENKYKSMIVKSKFQLYKLLVTKLSVTKILVTILSVKKL